MFNPKTVFVLGAGASCDFDLPTGDALRADLIEMLARDGDNLRFRNMNFNRVIMGLSQNDQGDWVTRFEQYAEAAKRISDGLSLATSIDNFLDTHQADHHVVEVGKIAITTVILEKEANSPLGIKADIPPRGNVKLAVLNTPKLAESWYLPLMRLIVANKTVHDVGTIFENVAFIVFNYDRCLEHFLVNAIINYFNVMPDVAVGVVNGLTIIHPYGQVSRLPWQENPMGEPVADFGEYKGSLPSIAKGIRTFTESMMSGTTASVKQLVQGANDLIFLGFGYLPQNVELLTVNAESKVKRVFATALNIGETDVEIATAEIAAMLKLAAYQGYAQSNVRMFTPFVNRVTCRKLLDDHWLRLTRRR